MAKKSWYSLAAVAHGEGQVATVSVHDEIGGGGITASDFMRDLLALGDVEEVHFSIHSPGGSLLDGWAMYNLVKNLEVPTTAHIEGYAASMATIVALAADTVNMPKNAYWMVHNPSVGNKGDASSMREMADLLDKFEQDLVNIYVEKTGKPESEVRDLMSAGTQNKGTWMNGEEALAFGFIDSVSDALEVAAVADAFRDDAEQLVARYGDLPIDLAINKGENEESRIENQGLVVADVPDAVIADIVAGATGSEGKVKRIKEQSWDDGTSGNETLVNADDFGKCIETVEETEVPEDKGGIVGKLRDMFGLASAGSNRGVSVVASMKAFKKERDEALVQSAAFENKVLAVETERDEIAAELLQMKNERHEVHELIAQAGFSPADAEELPNATADDGTSKDIYERYKAIECPKKRREFFRAHKVDIWQARDAG